LAYIYMYIAPNGKKYVGQTKSSLEKRRKDDYGTGYMGSPCFWNAIRYFGGLSNFTYEILEEVKDEDIDEREKYWIAYENSLVPNGYNIDKGGQGQHNSKPVDQYNLKGEKICSFSSIQAAAMANNCHVSAILNVLSKRRRQAHGSYWTYKDEPLTILKEKKLHRKPIYQFDLQGNLIKEFESARNADRYYGLPMGTCANCANKNNRRKRVGEYIFSYEEELDFKYYNLP
jgi:group I intron endonuclease